MMPGLTAFTRIPSGASSTASALVAVIIQPFEALYQFSLGRGLTPAVEATFRKHPDPRSFMPGTKDRAIMAELIMTGREMAKREGVNESGYKLLFNVEKGGGQMIFHLHLHLLGGWNR